VPGGACSIFARLGSTGVWSVRMGAHVVGCRACVCVLVRPRAHGIGTRASFLLPG